MTTPPRLYNTNSRHKGMDPDCPEHIVMVQYVTNGDGSRNYKLHFHYPAGQDPNFRVIEDTPCFWYWHGDAPIFDA